jgi:hypothetical protein
MDVDRIKQLTAELSALIDGAQPPGLSLAYAKRLGLGKSDAELSDLLAVKSEGRDTIRGYVALWGDPEQVDTDGEFFTAKTDFWDDKLPMPRPLTWDHAQDSATKADPVIGEITEVGNDADGKWFIAQLKRNVAYRRHIDELVERKALGASSDSAPQYILREKAKSAVWLKRWPIFACALTPTPAEPRMLDTVYWKSIALELPTAPDGAADGGALDSATADSLRRWFDILNILR